LNIHFLNNSVSRNLFLYKIRKLNGKNMLKYQGFADEKKQSRRADGEVTEPPIRLQICRKYEQRICGSTELGFWVDIFVV